MMLEVIPPKDLGCLVALAALVHTGMCSPAKGRGSGQTHLVTFLTDGSVCNVGNNAVLWANAWFNMRGQERVASADFELSRPTRSFQKIQFKIVRCPDAISYNTCEYFDTWKFNIGICPMLTNPGMPWSPWVRAIKPTFRCPTKAGNYSFRDVGIAASALRQFGIPLENNWYIVTLRLFDQDGLEYVCANYTVTFKRVRS